MSFAYMPFYTGDYYRDTRHLSMLQHGAYRLLLDHCWDQRGPLPLDMTKCYRICGATSKEEQDAVQQVVDEFFVVMEDGRYNRRIQREIERANALSSKRSGAAQQRWSAREAIKRIDAAQHDASALQLHNKSNASAVQLHSTRNASAATPSPTPGIQKDITPPTPLPAPPEPPPATRKRAAGFDPSGISLPAWMPREAWLEWCEDRRARGKRLTQGACTKQLAQLAEWRDRGDSPTAVLAQSIAAGWTGLFPLKAGNGAGSSNTEPAWRREQRERNEAFLGRFAARRPPTQPETIDADDKFPPPALG